MPEAVDRVLAMAHAGPQPHVAVTGRHALPVVLALLQRCFCRELQRHAMQAGLDIVSFDHVTRRVMLAPRPALAA
jgi:hypothetical protein